MQMNRPYLRLMTAIAINTVIMFFLTYTMIYTIDHFYFNLNRVYMALMMAAPMVVVMLILMRGMYMNMRLNSILFLLATVVFVFSILFVRTQTPIGNQEFLRAMIPHHSGAILMCKEADLTDPRIISLCDQIIKSQQDEINQMKSILEQYR